MNDKSVAGLNECCCLLVQHWVDVGLFLILPVYGTMWYALPALHQVRMGSVEGPVRSYCCRWC